MRTMLMFIFTLGLAMVKTISVVMEYHSSGCYFTLVKHLQLPAILLVPSVLPSSSYFCLSFLFLATNVKIAVD